MARAVRTPYQVTFAVLISGVMAYALLQSLVIPALPTIQHSLHTTQTATTWLVTAYLLSASVCTPILGRIGDVFGKERMFVVTLVALGVGTGLAAVSQSIGLLIVARLIQGAGGGVLPLAFGIIRDEFPREKVAGAIGLSAAMIAVGSGLGITVAGPIVAHLGYHWLFIIPLFLIVPAAIATHLLVPRSPTQTAGRVSVRGALLLSGWLVALLLGISQGSSWGWFSWRTDALFAVAIVTGLVWARVESRSVAPLIDMQMMRLPAVWTTNLTALLLGVSMYSVMAFQPEFIQTPKSAGYGYGLEHRGHRCALAAFQRHDVRHRAPVRTHCRPLRVQAAGHCRGPDHLRGLRADGVRPRRGLGDVGGDRPHGAGHRRSFLRAVEPRRGVGSGPSDRRRERDERQHPHHRRLDRQPGVRKPDRQHRRRVSAAEGIGLRHRVPLPGCDLRGRRRRGCLDTQADAVRPPEPGRRRGGHRRGPDRQQWSRAGVRTSERSRVSPAVDTTGAPPLRRDAAANRERILTAAVEVFSASGAEAGIDEVARRAGVGVGTVYRRFPTKDALLAAIVAQLLRDLVSVARQALDAAPEAGLAEFLRGAGELQARHAGCLWQLWSGGHESSETLRELRAIGQQLLARAQESGAVRGELVYEDIGMLLWSLAGVIESAHGVDPQLWRRTLEIMLHGMKPAGEKLAHPPLPAGGLDAIARLSIERRGSGR